MQTSSFRAALIAVAAVGGAVIWGLAEFLALQWSRLRGRLRALRGLRT